MFTVSTLPNCKQCGESIDRTINKRLRSYCSDVCRARAQLDASIHARKTSTASRDYQRAKYDARARVPFPGGLQCAICLCYYRRVLRHAQQRHGISAREYKFQHGLAVGRGILHEDDRQNMSQHTRTNGTIKNLGRGVPHRYTVGDKRTRQKSNPWGSKGAPRPSAR